jgi:hypothetical protein
MKQHTKRKRFSSAINQRESVVAGQLKKPDMNQALPLIELAVIEDFGKGDPTSDLTVGADELSRANVVTREEIVVCGMRLRRRF